MSKISGHFGAFRRAGVYLRCNSNVKRTDSLFRLNREIPLRRSGNFLPEQGNSYIDWFIASVDLSRSRCTFSPLTSEVQP